MTTPHSRTTLAALALLLLGCSVGMAHVAFARPHSMGATSHIYRSQYHGIYYYTKCDSLVYAGGSDHAFLKFDLPNLPIGALVIEAWANYYQYQWNSPYTALVYLSNDPTNRSVQLLYYDIWNGLFVTDQTTDARRGWIRRTLNASGISTLQACLSQGWYAVGVRPESGSGRATAYTSDSARSPFLEVSYYVPGDPDMAVLGARVTTYPLAASGTDTIEATLTYLGNGTASPFYVHLMRDTIRIDSLLVTSLVQGETTRVPFAVRNQTGGFANYCCFSNEASDAVQSNDSAWIHDWVFPAGTYAAEGFNGNEFPPAGWDTLFDGGLGYWRQCPVSESLHSGSGAAMCRRDTGMRNDDWLISSAVMPTAEHADSGGFFYRGLYTTNIDSLEVWALSSQERTDTLGKLTSVRLTDVPYQVARFSLDQFDGDTVFIGIRDVSKSDYWYSYAYVDDVFFLRHPSGGVEAPTAAALPVSFSVIPNPARSGEAVSIRCPTGEPARLSVYDALGRSVWFAIAPQAQTADTRPLVLPRLAAGVYLVRLESGSETATAKLVIQP